MTLYRVVKKVTLLVGRKKYHQDAVVSVEIVGKAKIKSWLAKGYIVPIGDPDSIDLDEEAQDDDVFMPPEKLDKLSGPKLIEYAKGIGLEGFAPSIKKQDLRPLIDAHIEELRKESGNGEPGGKSGEDDA